MHLTLSKSFATCRYHTRRRRPFWKAGTLHIEFWLVVHTELVVDLGLGIKSPQKPETTEELPMLSLASCTNACFINH